MAVASALRISVQFVVARWRGMAEARGGSPPDCGALPTALSPEKGVYAQLLHGRLGKVGLQQAVTVRAESL